MKLSALFAKYLYLKKELKLPGIGVFSLDPSVFVPDPAEKNFPEFLHQIKYSQKPVLAADDDFINFIRTETGKIRPLAESDLDSYLTDGKILLNIGKPFHLEGIGSITKTREGVYEFTPGEPVHNKDGFYKEVHEETPRKKTVTYGDEQAKSGAMRMALLVLGIIGGLAFVIWGGYKLYNKNTTNNSDAVKSSATPVPSGKANTILDSVQSKIDSAAKASSATGASQTYKFIIERTTNKARADKRFIQISEASAQIKRQSPDPGTYELYFALPAQPSDTARIRDSLKIWYARKNVYITR